MTLYIGKNSPTAQLINNSKDIDPWFGVFTVIKGIGQ